jgi:hypothetical protein
VCAAVVGVGEGAETFLPGGVEEVQAVGFSVDGEFLELGACQLLLGARQKSGRNVL